MSKCQFKKPLEFIRYDQNGDFEAFRKTMGDWGFYNIEAAPCGGAQVVNMGLGIDIDDGDYVVRSANEWPLVLNEDDFRELFEEVAE